MKDLENNIVHLNGTPNPHVLTWGRSGQGKTWFACRRAEEDYGRGQNILILDYSGSYTKEELAKNQFAFLGSTDFRIFDVENAPFFFTLHGSNAEKQRLDIVDALYNALGLQSYVQRTLLQEAIFSVVDSGHYMTLSGLFSTIENKLTEERMLETPSDHINNYEKLLLRLSPYRSIENLHIGVEVGQQRRKNPWIHIIQLSGFPERQRMFLTGLFTELLWKEICGNAEHPFRTIIFDEFRFISIKAGSPLTSMLREGRKHGIALLLCTQFITNYSREEQETLLQAGNILIFHPAPSDKMFSACIIDQENKAFWHKILRHLNVGEAVLVGNYKLGGHSKNLYKPIICKT